MAVTVTFPCIHAVSHLSIQSIFCPSIPTQLLSSYYPQPSIPSHHPFHHCFSLLLISCIPNPSTPLIDPFFSYPHSPPPPESHTHTTTLFKSMVGKPLDPPTPSFSPSFLPLISHHTTPTSTHTHVHIHTCTIHVHTHAHTYTPTHTHHTHTYHIHIHTTHRYHTHTQQTVFLRWWLGPSVSSKWMTISSVLVTDESSSSPPLSGIARASKVLNIGTDVDMLIVLFGAVAAAGERQPSGLRGVKRPDP